MVINCGIKNLATVMGSDIGTNTTALATDTITTKQLILINFNILIAMLNSKPRFSNKSDINIVFYNISM